MSWLTLANLLLKVVGGVLNHFHESKLIQAGKDAATVAEIKTISRHIRRARSAVNRATVDATELRNKYRRK
jgi:hypothetical protein